MDNKCCMSKCPECRHEFVNCIANNLEIDKHELQTGLEKLEDEIFRYNTELSDSLTKNVQLQAENDRCERKIEHIYHAISGIQDDDYRMQVYDKIKWLLKEDARTVKPMFKQSKP